MPFIDGFDFSINFKYMNELKGTFINACISKLPEVAWLAQNDGKLFFFFLFFFGEVHRLTKCLHFPGQGIM